MKLPVVYRSDNNAYEFRLNSDSTYNIYYQFQVDRWHSNGFFRLKDGKNVELNSSIQDEYLKLKVTSTFSNPSDNSYLKIDFNIPDGQAEYYIGEIFFDGKRVLSSHVDSLSTIPVKSIPKSFYIKIHGDQRMPTRYLDTLSTETYFVDQQDSQTLIININYNDSLFNYQVFKGYRMNIKRKKVEFFDPKKRTKVILYRRV